MNRFRGPSNFDGFQKIKEKIMKFMIGRYGFDSLSKAIMVVIVIFMVLSSLFQSQLPYLLSIVFIVIIYARALSKNSSARAKENQWYLSLQSRVLTRFKGTKTQFAQSKEYKFYHCPKCKQKVRVPRGKGKISITCPKCKTEFVKKS